jgi:hypothetical protein
MLSLWFTRIYIRVGTGTVMGVHGSAIGYCSAESQFPVHVRILPNLWGHTLKGR